MGRKLGAVPLLGELGLRLTQRGLGRGLSPYQLTECHPNLSSRLVTIHQRYRRTDRQDRQTDRQTDTRRHVSIGRTCYKWSPKKPRCSEETVQSYVRGVSPETGMESMVGKICERGNVGLEPGVEERGSYEW